MSIELDWEVTDAPTDPAPASGRLHDSPWQAAEDSPAQPSPPSLARPHAMPPARSRRRRLLLPFVALVVVAGIGLYSTRRITQLGWQRVTDDITALVAYEDDLSLKGQTALVLNVHDSSNPDWLAARRAQLEAALPAPHPLPSLSYPVGPSVIAFASALDGDYVVADVRRQYQPASGVSLEFVLPQVYLRDADGDWQRTAPPGHFWGEWMDWRSDVLYVRHAERDRVLVEALAPRLDAWLRAACQSWSTACGPAKLYLSGFVGSLEYDPLKNTAVRVEFGDGPGALPSDHFLSVSSPQISGVPVNAAAHDLLAEYLAVRLIASLAADIAASDIEAGALTASAIELLSLGQADPGYVALAAQQVHAAQMQTTTEKLRSAVAADQAREAYPRRAIWREYVIQPGDTLLGIAAKFGFSVADLVRINKIEDLDYIVAGATLVVPVAASVDGLPPP